MVSAGKFFALLAPFLASSVSAMFNATKNDFLKVYKHNGLRIPASEGSESQRRSISTRSNNAAAAQAAPHWTIYQDAWAATPPSADQIAGFNAYYLAFVLTSGPFDMAQQWVTMSADARAALKSSYQQAGIKLMATAFGFTDHPTSAGVDPVALANTMAKYVKDYGLDGLDVDYEDFDAMAAGTAENWLIAFTNQLRSQLPSPDYIITHARTFMSSYLCSVLMF
jgi:chitinase